MENHEFVPLALGERESDGEPVTVTLNDGPREADGDAVCAREKDGELEADLGPLAEKDALPEPQDVELVHCDTDFDCVGEAVWLSVIVALRLDDALADKQPELVPDKVGLGEVLGEREVEVEKDGDREPRADAE